MPVEAVIFDFGGVLWNMRWDVARALAEAQGLPRSSLFDTLYRTETWRAIERGQGDPGAWLEEAHRALEARAGRGLPPLHEEWRQAQEPIEPNLALARALRPPYRLAILSNADITLRRRIEDDMKIAALFDDVVVSAEVGMAKPEPEVFRLAAERLAVAPGACVFVDDWDQNIAAARAVGMETVLYRVDQGDDLEALLAAAGVTPRG